MPWEVNPDRPIYLQLAEQLELKICSGVYPLGSRLPSVRDLAQEASVNPNTMQRALAKLEEDGLVYTNRTNGKFVTENKDIIQKVKGKIAQEQVKNFLKKMDELGFTHTEILSIISEILRGGKQ
mgnify:CR=1 FL=1